ncbi:hypothetical protein PSN45_001144 [Yamadazyma tenuis]|uniref:F-box protein Hrt3/FBXO9 C-terminal domain-containing protein n=1 Tax=Candida tenuis (strain ATCC 10573 / BCRC 21748 / CBS 615 / JCM 9827 / NBRC 10315 / NRRL Y-1498 / VKM Y-70) TaxID=590646 RepID=G3B8P5_CANTC|nr:uncharacterized protein CANTEDRAFT_95290 [Yamadazyma tenuis ATCC 10573]EGV62404.1 hypothetical protein CANTEDRAFT_95290 [Yamadazyma tenuis ATCC 10573]WEJ93672.1 hypothetical protein PSN45_001144 [Yamadazyma tenuis]
MSDIAVASDHSNVMGRSSYETDVNLSDIDQQAIKCFEQAIEKESHGKMSDAIEFYRKAFKYNEKVDLLYRKTELPSKIEQMRQDYGVNSTIRVDEEVVNAIDVEKLLKSFEHEEARPPDPNDPNNDSITIKFANLGIDNHPNIEVKPVSPLVHLPNDIWICIMELLLITEPEAWINLSISCKKFAFLGLSSNDIWRKLCYLVYPYQNYEENQTFLQSNQTPGALIDSSSLPIPEDQLLILPAYGHSWKRMMDERPFLKFKGCYISVINYYSEGGKAEFSNSWSNPVKTITYYRYLRFYPDGTCVKVLSVLEPFRVVPQLSKYNLSRNITSALDQVKVAGHQSSVKEAHRIYHGKWTISTTGEVHINIDPGSVPYYTFHYHFQVKSLSRAFRYNKLNWIKYYTVRKQMSEDDDRVGEVSYLTIKNEKPFKFSRVKSYDVDTW